LVVEHDVVSLDRPRVGGFTAVRVGGRCDRMLFVHDRTALVAVLKGLRDEGVKPKMVGSGSSLVIRAGGVPGVIVKLGTGFSFVTSTPEGCWVGASTPVAAIADAPALREQDTVFSRYTGAGTMAGALCRNEKISRHVDAFITIRRGKEVTVSYDHAEPPKLGVIVAVHLRPCLDDQVELDWSSTPVSQFEGSWWKTDDRAVLQRVMREAGASGVRLRSVLVPSVEPDIIVSYGARGAEDVALLERSIIDLVFRNTGVKLTTAKRWMGRNKEVSHG
jgi:hypothetical protein